MPTSFRKDLCPPPQRYRTPSPPRDAFEPLSPITVQGATPEEPGLQWINKPRTYNGVKRPYPTQSEDESSPINRSHVSRGAMEAFASIALDTKSNGPCQPDVLNSKQTVDEHNDRPHKRARSERLPSSDRSMQWKVTDTRPATSYEQSPEDRRLEAELLLNFAQAAAQLMSPSPTQIQAQTHQDCISVGEADNVPNKGTTIDCPNGREEPVNEHLKCDNGAREQEVKSFLYSNTIEGDGPSVSLAKHDDRKGSLPPVTVRTADDSYDLSEIRQVDVTAVTPATHDHKDVNPMAEVLQVEHDSALVQEEVPKDPSDPNNPRFSMGLLAEGDLVSSALMTSREDLEATRSATPRLDESSQTVDFGVHVHEDCDIRLEGEPVERSKSLGMQRPPEEAIETESRAIHGALRDKEHTVDECLSAVPDNTTLYVEEVGVLDRDSNASISDDKYQSYKATAVCAACNFVRNSKGLEIESESTSWISCDACKSWFHFACAGFKSEREVRSVDKFRCRKCKPTHGSTTYVRKSSRAHSAIDYAGLHQGVIKTSDERPEHHYIKPIKEGTITFLPESFARMRPELVTAEYFEKGTGMKEPIVIPAYLNHQTKTNDTLPFENKGQNEVLYQHSSLEEEDAIEDWFSGRFESDLVADYGQDALDMVVPRGLTVRQVAELYGPDEKVEVIDVKSQNGENRKWNMRRWADYYENPNNKVVRNVISLEVSQSKLGRLIRRPQIVRDLDLQDSVWPEDLLSKGEYPRVQFYCLMSVADCFTDFHIDFGGSSVFYHILKGKKTFLFIPPKEKHLKKYEEWCMSPAQNWTFLGDQTKECYRVDLSEGDTMLIPSGWIHAVWTPEDSLVIGGNFLTRMNFGMQLRVAQVEKATGVARKFRYPHFQKLHWYTALRYLERDPLPDKVRDLLHAGGTFHRERPAHLEFDSWGENSRAGQENYHARYYSQSELEGLPDLTRYLLRTALIDFGNITDGISADTHNAVKKSIPRGHGEPLDIMKSFAAWCAWKRGNEPIPHWAYPDAVPENLSPDKLSATAMKKLDREAALSAPRRQSIRKQAQQEMSERAPSEFQVPSTISNVSTPGRVTESPSMLYQSETVVSETPKRPRISSGTASTSHRKTACESCRKRRRACKHKDLVALSMVTHAVGVAGTKPTDIEATAHYSTPSLNTSVDTSLYLPALGTSNEGTVASNADTSGRDPKQSSSAQSDSNELPHVHNKLVIEPVLSAANIRSEEPKINLRINGAAVGSLEPDFGNTVQSRPRHKACNECRKSKRRCIHDAFGKEDPIKVRETAIPRPHARKSNVQGKDKSTKKATVAKQRMGSQNNIQHEVVAAHPAPLEPHVGRMAPVANMIARPTSSEPHANGDSMLPDASEQENLPETASLLLDPALFENSTYDLEPKVPYPDPVALDLSLGLHEKSYITPDHLRSLQDQRTSSDYTPVPLTDTSAPLESRGNLQQPAASLVSPPASLRDDADDSSTVTKCQWTPSRSPSEQSQKQTQHRYTPESGPIRRASSSSNSEIAKKEAAPLDLTRSYSGLKSRAGLISEYKADEESLRLIKELQAQELGLRRRGKA